ncbi:MAG: pimeloyl-ACP methyl ester carboxylesterase [Pseudoalteromonas tetraodonis]|jgi:pimeloyl-ACP methyl ester carboxylesterase
MNHTRQILLLVISTSLLFSGCSTYSKMKGKRGSALTETATQKQLQKSLRKDSGQPLLQLGNLLDAADTARLKLQASPANTLAQADYNFAVSRVVEIVEEEKLALWDTPAACASATGEGWSLSLNVPNSRPEYHPSKFQLLPADRFEFKGKLIGERILKQGLGAPIVAVGKDLDYTAIDEFALGKQIFYGMTAVIRFDGRNCNLNLIDPLENETIDLDGHSYTLGADFQAPLALGLAEMSPRKRELGGMFAPSKDKYSARLSRLQPYNSEKIPILFIHGLGDSRATWLPMIDFLRQDANIRQHYQFWCFSYPTGLPYALSTAHLRSQLDKFSQRYPDHKDIVVVGHSMGGMISRLLITDSGMKIWDAVYDKPPGEMPFSEDTRQTLSDALIFEARPDISRVIYASASHRGSDKATNVLGRLGAKIIGDPIAESALTREAIEYAREIPSRPKKDHLPNSVDALDPDNMFLKLVDALPPKSGIPYHSIIGDRGKGGNLDHSKPVSSDGIVPYWSSHLDGAASEVIIPSGHWSIHHERGMEETKKILLQHLQ